jgi:hypothetical protein
MIPFPLVPRRPCPWPDDDVDEVIEYFGAGYPERADRARAEGVVVGYGGLFRQFAQLCKTCASCAER